MRQLAAKHEQSSTLSMVNVRNSELNRLRLNKGNENEVEEVELEEEEEEVQKKNRTLTSSELRHQGENTNYRLLVGRFVCLSLGLHKKLLHESIVVEGWDLDQGARRNVGVDEEAKEAREILSLAHCEVESFSKMSLFIIIPGKMLQ